MNAIQNPETADPVQLTRARRISTRGIRLQWGTGDAQKAEDSFFTINKEATKLDEAEQALLKAREEPNALAARAIVRAGSGHKYWDGFSDDKQSQIETLAKELFGHLFTPTLATPIKTLDLPVAGREYSAGTLPLMFDVVKLINRLEPRFAESDGEGDTTIECLKRVRRISFRITTDHPSSLGLHPALYFYALTGNHPPAFLLAIVLMLQRFEERDYYRMFTEKRQRFEAFLLAYKDLPAQINRLWGAALKSFDYIEQFYWFVLDRLPDSTDAQIVTALEADKTFSFLKFFEETYDHDPSNFTTDVKSEAFMRRALPQVIRCEICQGLLPGKSLTWDHDIRRREGGAGSLRNAQPTHPYCNTTFKN